MNASLLRSTATDEQLVALSLDGAREALSALALRHQVATCSVAYSVCGDLAASQEIAQDAFVSAWKQLDALREPARFRAWIYGISRWIALNEARRRARRRESSQPQGFGREPAASEAAPKAASR